jgi:hypothetical protein
MYELLFLVGALLPILIPVAIIIAVVKSRKTNRLLRVHDAEIIGLKDEIRRLGAHMKSVERKVRELRLAAGDVARVSGEVEMGAQARRAAKPAVTRKEKIAKKVVKPALPVKRKANRRRRTRSIWMASSLGRQKLSKANRPRQLRKPG